ncbi:tetratricopeptide repeat protein [Lichenihabitans psoromatis]|uniref:tetratricopeptide repeat protein n=1 Tax=Lichenihabitans psoromatis TaxID=2528642 RepID=UPI001036E2FE|nr:hypothetical protein [Lichenihabitans psoromatis]
MKSILRNAGDVIAELRRTPRNILPHLKTYTADFLLGFFREDRRATQRLIFAIKQANDLERQWRLEEAAARWKTIWTDNPQAAISHAGYAGALRKLNRCAESDAVLSVARQAFADDPNIWLESAATAHRSGDSEAALTFASHLVAHFPERPHGYEAMARAYREQQRFDEADAILLRGRALFPAEASIASEYAATADMRGDWAEGLRRWQDVRTCFPKAAYGYAGVGASFRRLKRFDDADAVLVAGMAQYPNDENLAINHAWVADDRGESAEAMRRWTALRARFPTHPTIRTGWVESQNRANLAEVDRLVDQAHATAQSAPPPELPTDRESGHEPQFRDLFMGFESLGENCEFGFVQRHFGAEPLGLLRWTGITFDKLLSGLAVDFDGVGTPDRTVMELNPSNHEYYTTDRVYGLAMHTFMTRDEGNEARIYQKLCRRLQYLRTKLLDDLRAAEKIMVFQAAAVLTDDDLIRLHDALLRHGRNRLLCVQATPGGARPGSVRLIRPGLMAGSIDRVGFDGKAWAVSFEIWLQLCQAAEAASRATHPTCVTRS